MIQDNSHLIEDTDLFDDEPERRPSGAEVMREFEDTAAINLDLEAIKRAPEKVWLLGECGRPYDGASPIAFIRDEGVILIVHLEVSKSAISVEGGEVLEIDRARHESGERTALMSRSDIAQWLQEASFPPAPTDWLALPAHTSSGERTDLDWWWSTDWTPPSQERIAANLENAQPAHREWPTPAYARRDRIGGKTTRRPGPAA